MKPAELQQKSAGSARLGFDMLISDFGPIKKAAISLRPLTIFIGGNDTGKSYAAMLAHSVMSAERGIGRRAYAPARSVIEAKNLEKMLSRFEKVLGGLVHADKVVCPPRLAAQMACSCIDEYSVRLQREIVRNFGSSLQELTRSGAGHFSIALQSGSRRIMSYKKSGLAVHSMPKFNIMFEASSDACPATILQSEQCNGNVRCLVAKSILANQSDGRLLLSDLYARLKLEMLRQAVADIPSRSRYFPAARSGILQAHRVIASNAVKNSSYAGIKNVHVPRLSGVVSDFLSDIIDIQPTRGHHHDIGSQIKNDIFGGSIRLKYSHPGAIPEILCERSTVSVPMRRASSAVSELAPFTLHLKHRAEGHGVIIIEEPEAHLHPRSQSLLGGHIVKLVREGASIIITTHSSILFESASQYLRASRLRPQGRKNALGDEDMYLREDEIAPYIFRADGEGGSVAERIDLSAKDGIEQDAFVKEDRLLNEANLRIEENEG